MSQFLTAAILSSAVILGPGAASAQPPLSTKPAPRCFFANDWSNWTAPDEHTMYLRVRTSQVYRIEFKNACQQITWPDVHTITVFHGNNLVCSAVDLLDFRVADAAGIAEPCIVSNITPLSPADVAALPKSARP